MMRAPKLAPVPVHSTVGHGYCRLADGSREVPVRYWFAEDSLRQASISVRTVHSPVGSPGTHWSRQVPIFPEAPVGHAIAQTNRLRSDADFRCRGFPEADPAARQVSPAAFRTAPVAGVVASLSRSSDSRLVPAAEAPGCHLVCDYRECCFSWEPLQPVG